MEQKRKLVLMGNDAVGEAALRCGCTFFAGYPISPQTQILDYLAREMPKRGCTFLQADSELGAINMVIGASIAGARALTVSSSTGLALMYEAFAAAADGEFPMVIMDVTREGAAQTGIKASQSDYNMLTKSFGDGGLRVPVLTPSTVQELAELVGLAFDLAERYRTPVVSQKCLAWFNEHDRADYGADHRGGRFRPRHAGQALRQNAIYAVRTRYPPHSRFTVCTG